ncbi:unnamed protein product, partial [Rotaria socialis]
KMQTNESASRSSLSSMIGENHEIFSLVWLDISPSDDTHDSIDVQQQLRSIINHLIIFQDTEECEQYITSASKEDRLVFIINEKYALKMIKNIYDIRQIISFYIHSTDDNQDYQWTSQYKKIKSIKSDINELISNIKVDHAKQRKLEEPIPINVFDANQSIDRLVSNANTEFLHSQLLIHFLLHIELTNEQITENKKELMELCKRIYHDNSNQLKILNEFEHNYVSSNALWWYTFDSFLYQLLNKSLNSINIDLLYLLQFFICELTQQLEKDQSSSIVRVYRGYVLSNDELELFKESTGKYISINTFFSAYIRRNDALDYLNNYEHDINHAKKVLFKIDIDPRLLHIKPLANITIHSQATHEEVLFSLGSIFRVNDIHRGKNEPYVVTLILCSDDTHQLKPVFDYIKHQFDENSINLLSFGNALKRTGKLDEAEKCYQRLLHDSTYNKIFISRSYHHLGRIAERKGDYDASLECLYKSLEVKLEIMKPNDPSIAQSYNCIGIAYQQQGNLEKALDAFNKALTIWRRAYGKNHPNVAGCYNNMGVVYKRAKRYVEALESFHKALDIRERHPSTSSHDLAGSHNNIGAVYERLGHHDLAIEHYSLSLKMKSKSLPTQHPSIASTLENMGYVYENTGANLQALSYLERAAMIYRHSLPPTHHDVMQIEESIQRVSLKLY